MRLSDPLAFVYLALALLISLSIHEAAHALLAYSLGDPTAKNVGRLTLNPLRHLDPLGTIFLLFMAFSGVGIGWAKPVPVDPSRLRGNPKTGMAIVALAGPLSNMVLAALIFAVAPTLDLEAGSHFARLLQSLFLVNVSLAAFNLIPIPPLDGFSVLLGLLPNRPAFTLSKVAPYGPAVLMMMIFLPIGILPMVLGPLRDAVISIVTFGSY